MIDRKSERERERKKQAAINTHTPIKLIFRDLLKRFVYLRLLLLIFIEKMLNFNKLITPRGMNKRIKEQTKQKSFQLFMRIALIYSLKNIM